jgi:hypothetical protein
MCNKAVGFKQLPFPKNDQVAPGSQVCSIDVVDCGCQQNQCAMNRRASPASGVRGARVGERLLTDVIRGNATLFMRRDDDRRPRAIAPSARPRMLRCTDRIRPN